MKRIIMAIAVCAFMTGGLFAQSKIGHVNSQDILAELPERADAEKQAQDLRENLENRINAMVAEYQNKGQTYQNLPATATQTERESLQNELIAMEQNIQNAENSARNEIAQKEQELIQPMLEKVQNAINDVAKENEFSYILDTSVGVVVFFDGGEDIGPLVKQKLGMQ